MHVRGRVVYTSSFFHVHINGRDLFRSGAHVVQKNPKGVSRVAESRFEFAVVVLSHILTVGQNVLFAEWLEGF